MFADSLDKLHLLFHGKASDGCLDNSAEGYFVHCNEAVVVHVCKEAHDKLAIHAISDSTMPWDRIPKVLNFEGTLETRGKEAAEWCDKGGESSKNENMNLHWRHVERLDVWEPDWKVIKVRYKDWIWYAFKTGEDVRTEVLADVRLLQRIL